MGLSSGLRVFKRLPTTVKHLTGSVTKGILQETKREILIKWTSKLLKHPLRSVFSPHPSHTDLPEPSTSKQRSEGELESVIAVRAGEAGNQLVSGAGRR